MKLRKAASVGLLSAFAIVVMGLVLLLNQSMMSKESKSVEKHHNQLIFEKSPYLLQHADNPVDWYPWGKEAFEKARKEDKPIFLSIGYSTCHWCHVMAHESFNDSEVAKLMNEVFVSIKVDREERPDIDNVYMTVCQMLTGSGGWPLTIIMTPDKKPFFAATYIPKESRFGRIGMLNLIPNIKELWKSRRDEIIKSSEEIAKALKDISKISPGEELGKNILDTAYSQISKSFDEQYGGFGNAPKFPTPHKLAFLLRYGKRAGEEKTLYMVEKTLEAMRLGGIYDHVGFGFHRYSTDFKWLVPHFEKMLYDQALLAMAYTEAFQVTDKKEYERTTKEIFTYVLRDMMSPEGGFYSAEDADVEGEEGRFYLWTEDEIRKILTVKEAEFAIKVFNIEKEGNFHEEATGRKTKKNILHLKKTLPKIAKELEMNKDEIEKLFEIVRRKLFDARNKRVHSHKDDKILSDWNGLMIAAFAKGARVFDEPDYVEAAQKAADFILAEMLDENGRLYHRYKDSESRITGFLNDYAFFIWGLIELYETTFKVHYLKTALSLNEVLLKHFWDEKSGGFFMTPDYGGNVLVRKKEIYDGAIPSGNSVSMLNLIRLARMTSNPELEEKAAQIERAFSETILQSPQAFTQFMSAVNFVEGPSYEVVIVGKPEAEETQNMLRNLRKHFTPNKVVLFRPVGDGDSEIVKLAEFTRNLLPKEGKTTAFVCHNYKCELPTTDVQQMLRLLNVKEE